MSSANTRGRNCARCDSCCIYLEIESRPGYSTRLDTGEDIAKPANQRCAFLGSEGCAIYEARPLVCRQFRCDWLLGVKGFGPEDSPDQTGFMGVRGDLRFISDAMILEAAKPPAPLSAPSTGLQAKIEAESA